MDTCILTCKATSVALDSRYITGFGLQRQCLCRVDGVWSGVCPGHPTDRPHIAQVDNFRLALRGFAGVLQRIPAACQKRMRCPGQTRCAPFLCRQTRSTHPHTPTVSQPLSRTSPLSAASGLGQGGVQRKHTTACSPAQLCVDHPRVQCVHRDVGVCPHPPLHLIREHHVGQLHGKGGRGEGPGGHTMKLKGQQQCVCKVCRWG